MTVRTGRLYSGVIGRRSSSSSAPVHADVVAVGQHVLGRHVARGAAEGVRPVRALQDLAICQKKSKFACKSWFTRGFWSSG